MFSFRLLTSALLLLAPPLVHAQTSIHLGLRLGANWASRAGDDPTYRPSSGIGTVTPTVVYTQDYTRSGLLAPQFGAVLDVRFGKLSVQPAVLFSQKGADQRIADHYTVTYGSAPVYYGSTSDEQYHFVSRPNYLEIPLHFVLTTGGDNGFQGIRWALRSIWHGRTRQNRYPTDRQQRHQRQLHQPQLLLRNHVHAFSRRLSGCSPG